MNQQSGVLPLFENSPLPGRNFVEELKNEKNLIIKATDFAFKLIAQSQPTTEEFVNILTNYFSYHVRLYIFEIVENLRKDEYVQNHLTKEKIEKALQGANPPKQKEERTLDELFARSLELRTSTKLIEAMNFVAKIKKYSPFNNMLVFLQRPNATYWATASHWEKALERKVKQDAVPIIMLQPMSPVMLVYDVVDTEGKPLPKGIGDIFAVEGELDGKTYPRTLENCQRMGFFVRDVE